jgi:hypothetical protein
MSDGITPNLGLIKPDVGASDDTWGEKLNQNFDLIDLAVGPSGDIAATVEYVDDENAAQDMTIDGKVDLAGDVMTGHLTLNADPIALLHAATKQYVDSSLSQNFVMKTGDTMSGHLVLPTGPAASNAVRKDYVDAADALKLAKNSNDTTSGTIGITNATASTSPTTGALTVAGGLGVGSSINATGSLAASAVLTSFNSSIGFGVNVYTTNTSTAGGPMFIANSTGTQIGGISYAGAQTGVSFNTSSDAALKEDLKSFDAGNIIDNTNVYDFAWKSTKERAYGVIAQQANEVYPIAVTHTEKDEKGGREEWWGVDYSKYVPILLQELKALRQRVAELEGKTTIDPKKAN